MKKRQKRKISIVNRIPGGMYGTDPGGLKNPCEGRVVVDYAYDKIAIDWLDRIAKITSVKATEGSPPLLSISYKMKKCSRKK